MTAIVLSKGVSKFYRNDYKRMAKLEAELREFVDESERNKGVWFVPYPTTDADAQRFDDKQVEVTFLGLDPAGGTTNNITHETTMLLLLPLYMKEEGRNIWYGQLKDEFKKIELDYANNVVSGNQRMRGGK